MLLIPLHQLYFICSDINIFETYVRIAHIELKSASNYFSKIVGILIVVIIRVWNFSWFPISAVFWVLNKRSHPLPSVLRIANQRWIVLTTTGRFVRGALRVTYRWRFPFTIQISVPIFWPFGLWIWNCERFIKKPAVGRFKTFRILYVFWLCIVPVWRFLGRGIGYVFLICPIVWHLVGGIAYSLLGLDWRIEVFKKTS